MSYRTLFLFSALAIGPMARPAGATCPAPKPPAAKAVAARVAGQVITVADIDAELADALCEAEMSHAQRVAELRERALDQLIDRRLMAAEAKKRGLADLAALVAQLTAALPKPTEAEIQTVYDQNKDRLNGASLEAVSGDIAEYLSQQRQGEVVGTLIAKLRADAKVKVELPPFQIAIPPGGFATGPADAPVTIVEFADYQCPFCARAAPTVAELKTRYAGRVRFVFRDFPLENHDRALPAAIAARCAARQDKFWPMHEKLFANARALGDEALTGYANELGLDPKAFAACQADPSIAAAVSADAAVGRRLGVSGTPAFFVNGVPLSGAQPVEAFIPLIERALERR